LCSFLFYLLVVLVRLSVPVQVIDWKDSSVSEMTDNVLMGTLDPTHSPVLCTLYCTLCCMQVYVDGPFGAGQQDWVNYDVSVLVGGGIGVTPYASIIKDFVFVNSVKNTFRVKCRKVPSRSIDSYRYRYSSSSAE